MNIDGVSCPEIGLLFYSVGWGPAVRAVRVFCGWNLESRSSWGRSLATRVAQRASVHTSPSFSQVPYPSDSLHPLFLSSPHSFYFPFLIHVVVLGDVLTASDSCH